MLSSIRKNFIYSMFFIVSVTGTLYIFSSSAEFIFNQDFPVIPSINASIISDEIDYKISQSLDGSYSYSFTTLFEGRELKYIEIPVVGQKLELSKAINQDQKWIVKGNKANYLVIKNKKENDDIIIYFPKSWRTINDTTKIKAGDFLFLETNDSWNYIFKIESIHTYSTSEKFPLKAYSVMGITLVIEDELSNSYQVVEAKLINSRGES